MRQPCRPTHFNVVLNQFAPISSIQKSYQLGLIASLDRANTNAIGS
jgi:hypothetical protein